VLWIHQKIAIAILMWAWKIVGIELLDEPSVIYKFENSETEKEGVDYGWTRGSDSRKVTT
jgi:hypothetical protein